MIYFVVDFPYIPCDGSVSKEEPLTEEHDIVPDGYNIGR